MRIIVTWDTIPPVVKIVSPLANSAIAADVVPIHWTIDGVAQTTDTLFTLGDGANRVERFATDAAGNCGYHLHPDCNGFCVSGGHPGRIFAPCYRLGNLQAFKSCHGHRQ